MLILDITGYVCPMPILKLRRFMATMDFGQSVTVRASDPNTKLDIPFYCASEGYKVRETYQEDDIFIFKITKSKSK